MLPVALGSSLVTIGAKRAKVSLLSNGSLAVPVQLTPSIHFLASGPSF